MFINLDTCTKNVEGKRGDLIGHAQTWGGTSSEKLAYFKVITKPFVSIVGGNISVRYTSKIYVLRLGYNISKKVMTPYKPYYNNISLVKTCLISAQ